jgi:predicted GIY-YIG superfamily endonuclease
MTYSVYTLIHPVTFQPQYVGLAKRLPELRYGEHILIDGSPWIEEMKIELGLWPKLAVLQKDIEDRQEALKAEWDWIAKLEDQGFALYNDYKSQTTRTCSFVVKPKERTWSVYALVHPVTRDILYIGMSAHPQFRWFQHVYWHRPTWIAKLEEVGLQPELLCVTDNIETEDAARAEERFWNLHFLQFFELNSKGLLGRKKGSFTEEHRRNLSLAHKGRELSLQHAAKISEGLKGHVVTEETKAKIKATHQAKVRNGPEYAQTVVERARKMGLTKKTPEQIEKMRASLAKVERKPHSQETRDKISIALTGVIRGPLSEEHKAKVSAALKGKPKKPFTEEHKAKLSAAGLARFSDPESKKTWYEARHGRRKKK